MNKLQPDEFKKLEQEWYEILAQAGFTDIEETGKPERLLKCWHSFKYQSLDPITIQAVVSYFEKAKELLFTFEFPSEKQKKIWTFHVQGMTHRAIAEEVGCHRQMVNWTISRIARKNGLKK